MSETNANIAATLRRYASTLAVAGADRFKIKAYRRAADTVDHLDQDVSQMLSRGQSLTTLPGIGEGISGAISEILQTGRLEALDQSVKRLSPELAELSTQPGLDPKRVSRIYKKLGIDSLTELKDALESGRLDEQFDRRTVFHIRQGLSDRRRILLWEADRIAATIQAFVERHSGVSRFSTAGSLRRREETVGDLNFLVAVSNPGRILKVFEQFG
jgi:DNA polymerase (family X)